MVEENQADLRFLRTRKSILEAMVSLLSEKDFESITVKDICEKAYISRSGFYLHYKDKYDLVETYQADIMEKGSSLLEENLKNGQKIIMEQVITFLNTEGKILALLLSTHGSSDIQAKVKNSLQQNARKNILPKLGIRFSSKTEEDYFIVFMSSAFIGFIQEWINRGQKETPEQLVNILEQIFRIASKTLLAE